MGDTGQGSGNGGGGGTTRVGQQSGAPSLTNMQALAKKSGSAADQALEQEIKSAIFYGQPDINQQPSDTQRFFNGVGLCDKKPVKLKDEDAMEVEKFSGDLSGQYFYHTDMPTSAVPDAQKYGRQYMSGRQYLSSGIHGDGTYWSNSQSDSWGYGGYMPKSYQIKGMLNSNARVIKEATLLRQISKFRLSHPKASRAIERMSTGTGWSRGGDGVESVYAALFGYNVIQSRQGGCDYLTVLDRSATTVVRTGKHFTDVSGGTAWEYT